jgi:sec-independent protein translocase protein TatB
MQMFGVGVMELLVILLLAVIVVGPDKMPQLAADLARWIRQARAYSKHLMGDFNSVVSELEREANVSREDWKEIANIVSRNTGEIGKELERVTKEADVSGDLEAVKLDEAPVAHSNGSNGNGAKPVEATAEPPVEEESAEAEPAEEKPWYEPEKAPRASRRRRSE